jgi:hypothetical protein
LAISGLWTPDSATERRPHWRCEVCGSPFAKQHYNKYLRHVIACAKKHEDEIEEEIANEAESEFGIRPNPDIQEEFEFVRKQARAEGKLH